MVSNGCAGIIDTRAVVPIVGGGAYDGAPGQLVTAIEGEL